MKTRTLVFSLWKGSTIPVLDDDWAGVIILIGLMLAVLIMRAAVEGIDWVDGWNVTPVVPGR